MSRVLVILDLSRAWARAWGYVHDDDLADAELTANHGHRLTDQ